MGTFESTHDIGMYNVHIHMDRWSINGTPCSFGLHNFMLGNNVT